MRFTAGAPERSGAGPRDSGEGLDPPAPPKDEEIEEENEEREEENAELSDPPPDPELSSPARAEAPTEPVPSGAWESGWAGVDDGGCEAGVTAGAGGAGEGDDAG